MRGGEQEQQRGAVRLGVLSGFPGSADLGGLPLADGGTTELRRVVRSAVPVDLSVDDRRAAQQYGVGAVVDLRGEEEARLLPHPLGALPHYRLLPLVDPAAEALRDTGAEVTFGDLYSRSLERNRRTLMLVFGALADRAVSAPSTEAGAVLVCCAAGRDRTGMVAALLLDLAGVEREAVVDDYHRAGSGRPVVDLAAAPPPRRRGGPDIDAMLDHLHVRWGGPEAYLRWLGLDDRQATALRSLLRPTGAA